ncbi:ribosome recycling factor [Actinomarinicola tropica]|uniref:Ribosome-recycling factor n=1 Tax=Actinomarinicola tropica TaxID=2789776 RepID=A0A5Q2RJP4_9ACTN|nr:ribosome recycling factor [Actinomarinicola tropica]
MIELVLDDVDDRMGKAVQHARQEFATIRTGRATPALVERLPVEAYGEELPLQQLASFTVPEARQLLITPFDKGNLGAIEKAIQHSDLGMNPSNDGHSVRLVFPPLTEERRRDLVKIVRQMAEDGKVAIRNARRDARKELEKAEKDGDMSADDLQRAEKDLDKRTHAHEAEIDQALEQKEAELLEV